MNTFSDGNGSWKACVKYVDDQFAAYFDGESGLNRKNIIDTRVHCCLYFIPPYGHGLRQIDLEFLKRLQYKVNLIPVIAKADTLTPEEIKRLKENINKEIEDNDIGKSLQKWYFLFRDTSNFCLFFRNLPIP